MAGIRGSRDEVDHLLERALLTRPVTGLTLRVPGESRLVRPGRVDDAAQVLQPELPGRRVRHDGLVELEP
jgi:hypothetical protein